MTISNFNRLDWTEFVKRSAMQAQELNAPYTTAGMSRYFKLEVEEIGWPEWGVIVLPDMAEPGLCLPSYPEPAWEERVPF